MEKAFHFPAAEGILSTVTDDSQVGEENAQERGGNDSQGLGHDHHLAGGSVRAGELEHRLGITKKCLMTWEHCERQAGHDSTRSMECR